MRSAVSLATLVFLLSAATAHARPSFELTDTTARAGDAVRFSISGVDGWGVAYHLEIGGEDVLDGRATGIVAGSFAMPDLGDATRTVTVEAEIWWSDSRRTVKRRLEYAGPAPVSVGGPPAAAPAAPVDVPQPAPPPAPAAAPVATQGAPPAAPASPPVTRGPRLSRERRVHVPARKAKHGRERPPAANRAHERRKAHTKSRKRRPRRRARHYLGIPDALAGDRPGDLRDRSALTALAPHAAAFASAVARPRDGGSTAVVVPAILGSAALALAGTALLRRRRLASR